MQEDFFQILGVLVIGCGILYIVVKLFVIQRRVVEGLTGTGTGTASASGSSGPSPPSGEAGSASSYAAAVKAWTVTLQDELLVSKYRPNYESIIIQMDDYVGYLMLQQLLNVDPSNPWEVMNRLTVLNQSKDALNNTMLFLDKQ